MGKEIHPCELQMKQGGEREEVNEGIHPVPQPCYQEKKMSNRLLCHVQDDGGSWPAHRLTAHLNTFMLRSFFPLKGQLLAYKTSNNYIFFPGFQEEMQTTSSHVEEKTGSITATTTLKLWANNTEANLMISEGRAATGQADPGAVDTQGGSGVPCSRINPRPREPSRNP